MKKIVSFLGLAVLVSLAFGNLGCMCLWKSGMCQNWHARIATASKDSTGGDSKTSSSPYSAGFGLSAIKSLNTELKSVSRQYLKVSLMGRAHVYENVNVFLDANFFVPDRNGGIDFGFHYYFLKTRLKPFLGAGIGVHYFRRENEKFGNTIGPSGTIQPGLLIDVSKNVHVEILVPYHLVANRYFDQGTGLQLAFIFSNPLGI
ncbi:MAG: hypothetical protein JW795_15340 [Chitinivibrionales bacterium]|nr:hypothetical protein [Chitinivibrionales bacterium]